MKKTVPALLTLLLYICLYCGNQAIAKTESQRLPDFSILKQDVYDAPIKTQIVLDVLVTASIDETGLRQLLNNLYRIYSQKRGFKYHELPTHIAIYIYTSKEFFEAGMGQWIGRLMKMGESGQLTIDINSRQMNQRLEKQETIAGLSEAQRKRIWKEIVLSERKAEREADRKYPLDSVRAGQTITLNSQINIIKSYTKMSDAVSGIDLPPGTRVQVIKIKSAGGWKWCFVKVKGTDVSGWTTSVNLPVQDYKTTSEKQSDLEQQLRERYGKELMKKYGLTEKQFADIKVEGITKDWPFPK